MEHCKRLVRDAPQECKDQLTGGRESAPYFYAATFYSTRMIRCARDLAKDRGAVIADGHREFIVSLTQNLRGMLTFGQSATTP